MFIIFGQEKNSLEANPIKKTLQITKSSTKLNRNSEKIRWMYMIAVKDKHWKINMSQSIFTFFISFHSFWRTEN